MRKVKIDNAMEKEMYKLMTKLNLTYEEAQKVYYFDKEELDNEDVDAIESKIKSRKDAAAEVKESPIAKVKTMKAKKKIDEKRTYFLNTIFNFVRDIKEVKRTKNMTSSKMSFEAEDGTYYSVTITKHKSKPNGFDVEEKEEV